MPANTSLPFSSPAFFPHAAGDQAVFNVPRAESEPEPSP